MSTKNMGLEIKIADREDLQWVNDTYKAINFLPSTLNDEIVAIAYVNGVKAGLGRVAIVDSCSCELGGMYVDPPFRGRNIARKIVEFLLERAQKPVVYCIPFVYLCNFYKSFGFKELEQGFTVPGKVREKLGFTKTAYTEETTLLVMAKDETA